MASTVARAYNQGRSQEFTKGDKPGGLGDGSPNRDPGAEYGNPRQNTNTGP